MNELDIIKYSYTIYLSNYKKILCISLRGRKMCDERLDHGKVNPSLGNWDGEYYVYYIK